MRGPATGSSVLDEILARTRQHVANQKTKCSLEELQNRAQLAQKARPFASALRRKGTVSIIAEHKRRSPSRGAIREDLVPADVARGYEAAGAAALSVLTDEPFFGGRLEHLVEARGATRLPALRKDFLVDPWQVWETRAAGADAVLLIVAAVGDDELKTLLETAGAADLDALVEVHNRGELDRALGAGARIVGVNSRNLKTMEVSLETAISLSSAIPGGVVKVAESGIRTGEDVRRLREAGFDALLIGERLMSAPDPGGALRSLIEESA
ncbi:MAG: indole-3-glycerol phosphate synthase TrpC [Acidobacteria bacterium]|jgi:indole-3-glycerol phosphate synthase|nr:indole-3-glycerol phosphate synthase TrpC [Acidobacteriota bacterium]